MDYVQEELARQRLALALLMTGGRTEAPAEEAGIGGGPALPSDGDALREAARAAPAAEGPSGARTGTADSWEAAAETAAELLAGEMPSSARSAGQAAETQMETGRTGAAGTAGGPAEKMEMRKSAPAGGGVRERTVTEVLWADAGGTSGAKELSRTFQRDARRYDGGFSLY